MKLDLASLARKGLLALGVLGALAAPALAGPANLASGANTAAPAPAIAPLLVQSTDPDYGNDRPSSRLNGRWDDSYWLKRRGGGRHWDRPRRHWDGDWRPRRHWDRDWYPRRHYRPRSGIYFNLDIGPRYVEPRRYYQPRRVYRSGGSAHVRWCYNRYRSYRAWDNTFQPYYGPRQQCISPYI